MRVDEPRADDPAGGVEDSVGARAVDLTDVGDPPRVDHHVATDRWAPSAVDDPAAADEEVRHFVTTTSPTPPPTRGSSTSRSPSPRKLNPITTIMIARPGKIDIQTLWSM